MLVVHDSRAWIMLRSIQTTQPLGLWLYGGHTMGWFWQPVGARRG